MPRELLIVVIVVALLGSAVVSEANRAERARTPRWLSQVGLGLLCGAGGALAAAAPYVDLVPDAYEVQIGTAVITVTMGLVVLVGLRARAEGRRAESRLDEPSHGMARERARHARRPRRVADHLPRVRPRGRHAHRGRR